MVSVFVRQSLVQIVTPDAMRGRVSAVSSLFIGASNELGEFESGGRARLRGPVVGRPRVRGQEQNGVNFSGLRLRYVIPAQAGI
jgi:hypothetical protein